MSDAVFAKGIFCKHPHERAPEYIKATVSFRVDEVIDWLRENANADGWCKVDIKEARNGNLYAQLNTFAPRKDDDQPAQPTATQLQEPEPDDQGEMPF